MSLTAQTPSPVALDRVSEILQEPGSLRPLQDGIWTALPPGAGPQAFDSISGVYDLLAGNASYQRLVWGNDIARDTELARRASRDGEGWLLDAGCGSLLFTADVHRKSARTTALFDLSASMLRRGRKRLADASGRIPEHTVLLQGDVLAAPFAAHCFDTILCPGILHMFADHRAVLAALARLLKPGGRLYLSCLVTDRPLGARMLRLMQRGGEVPNPIDSTRLAEAIEGVFGVPVVVETRGNMAHAEVQT